MNDLIVIRDPACERCEELLLRRNELKKECLFLELEYTRTFGELIIALFKKQIECAQKKKAIEFCQIALNRGETPDEAQLARFIQRETQKMRRHLDELISRYDSAKDAEAITQADAIKIKTIYRRIARRLHPDLNPRFQSTERLKALWHEAVSAYERNDLQALSETEVLINRELSDFTGEISTINIPDVAQKMAALEAEIAEIMNTNPYQYKFLLADEEAVAARKDDLEGELSSYLDYSARLDAMLYEITGKGETDALWGTN